MLCLLFVPAFVVRADDLQDEYEQKQFELEQIRQKKQELEEKIRAAQDQEATLANQIAYLDNSIYLTELEINETQSQIIQTQDQLLAVGQDIDRLTLKLGNLESSIEDLSRVLKARIRASYELNSTTSLWQIFFFSGSLDRYVLRCTYLTTLQYEDRKLMKQMKSSQELFSQQKQQLEALKREKEELKAQLEDQKAQLDAQQASLSQQKSNKQYLLEVTQNEETKYQELLASLKQDEAAIRDAINSLLRQIAGNVLAGTAVKRGDIIGLEGNTGAVYPKPTASNPTAGAHVHFSVLTCGSWSCATDPMPYINNGTLRWPLDNFVITQGYGYTWFAAHSSYYEGGFHNGIDLRSDDGYGAPVKAAADGVVYYTVDGYGGHGAIVKHGDNLYTAYWHLQPVRQ